MCINCLCCCDGVILIFVWAILIVDVSEVCEDYVVNVDECIF